MSYDLDDDFNEEVSDLIDNYDAKKTKSLNALALCRRVPECMRPYKPSEGCVFVSCDLCSAEPSIMLNISGDPMLHFFLYEAKGKAPHYENEVLLTDSMYVTYMSTTQLGKEILAKGMRKKDWVEGEVLTFAEAWMRDSDLIKKWLDREGNYYRVFKQLTLALFYGLGGKGIVAQMSAAGRFIDEKEGYAMHKAFWGLFKELNNKQKSLQSAFRASPFITNPLGFKLNTEEHKVLNAYVQSTVSSFISIVLLSLDELDYVKYIMTYHDELIFEMPEGRIPDFIEARDGAAKSLNAQLGFKYPLSFGIAVGNNLYEAH